MCFFKKEENTEYIYYQPCQSYPLCSGPQVSVNNQFFPFYNVPFMQNTPTLSNASLANSEVSHLQTILGQLRSANQSIISTIGILQENQNRIDQAVQDISLIESQSLKSSVDEQGICLMPEEELVSFKSNSVIVKKLFGTQDYKYKIKITSDFPKQIYKYRNLHIPVKLTTKKGELVRNGNLIHLCLAVCDENEKWIMDHEGDSFMKGKLQIDFYRGESEFIKIYPKDITRHLGKINIIIYPRASVVAPPEILQKGQRQVDVCNIEPLIIHNIVVKSKKKKSIFNQ